MRRLFVFVATWLALCGSVVAAQQVLPGFPAGAFSNKAALDPAAYVGPGDVVSGAIAWWGLRCYANAYSGNVADITDSSTGNTTGTRLQCSSGTVSALVSASACTFVAGNACSTLATTCAVACNVEELYDQSGANSCSSAACHLTQATNADRPTLTLNCLNSTLPCMTFNGSAVSLTSSSSPTQAQPFTFSTVSKYTGATCGSNSCVIIVSDSAANYIAPFYHSNTNKMEMEAASSGGVGAPTSSTTAGQWYTHQMIFLNAAPVMYQDAVSQTLTGTLGASGMANTLEMGNDTFSENLIGAIAEVGVWAGSFSSTQATNMCHNQFTYWATATSC